MRSLRKDSIAEEPNDRRKLGQHYNISNDSGRCGSRRQLTGDGSKAFWGVKVHAELGTLNCAHHRNIYLEDRRW